MLNENTLSKFALLTLKIGVNLQKGQGLEIACPVEKREVAVALTKTAYELGAKKVNVRWNDDEIDRLTYLGAETDALCAVPKWFVDSKNYLVKEGWCYVAIAADDPDILVGVPEDKIAKAVKAKSIALKNFSQAVMSNKIRWCVVSVPTRSWAKKVFPNSRDPEKDLENAIALTMRLDSIDPVKEWGEHIENLERRAEFLNSKNFEYLHFKNALGTNLKVGLCKNHVWLSARERAQDGFNFVANMPTEEVFTAPHRLKVDGVLKSSMPLCENGNIIEDFTIEFKKGKIVSFSAKKGYETLKNLIDTDKGTKRLGEVALIGKNSPIAKLNTLFYNTLFDENASCHLAIGKAYPTTVKGGDTLTLSELKELGANDSVEHVDFMIGTSDLSVTGIDYNGNSTPIFIDGEWVI